MIASLDSSPAVPSRMSSRARVAAGATLLAWLALAALIAASYLGHSASPYGVCYAASGRSVPCAVVRR